MPVLVYPSKLEGEPLERHEVSARMSVHEWLSDNVRGYEVRESAPISVSVNGQHVEPSEWALSFFADADEVCIYPEPKAAGAAFLATYGVYIAAAVVLVAAIFLQPSIPKAGKQREAGGDKLNEASIKGNKIKINQVIREVSGTRKIFPDYLIPIHRYFADPRQQVVETHLSFGKGEFEIPTSQILIGDTPLVSLGNDAQFSIYGPGASVAADSRAVWWHSAPEIGATSTGTAGLELTVTTAATVAPNAAQYIFSGFSISIPGGAGVFPSDWEAGMIVRIEAKYPYTITDGVGAGVRDVITGDIDQLAFTNGALIEIAGDNEGDYIVDVYDNVGDTLTLNYSNGDPAASLVLGSRRMAIGYRGLRYRVLTAGTSSITVERLTDTGATDPGWPGFSDITLDDAILTLDESTQEGDWAGPFSACPKGELTSQIEWDVFFPGGLIKIGSKGQSLFRAVSTELQYRDADIAGSWTSIPKSYTQKTLDQIGFTETATLPYPMRPEVRIRRIGAKSTSPQVQDTVQWYGLRSKLQAPTSYAGVTTMTLKVRGGGKLAAQSEQLVSAVVTRKIPTRVNGVWTAPVVTRDIAPWIAYVAKSLGYTDGDLDLDELDRLDAIWKARGDTYDNSTESATTAKEALNLALRSGFSELTVDRGLIRPVRDEPRSTFEHMYTPQNMTAPLQRQFQSYTPDDFDGVDVEYTDSRTWTVETVECRLPGDLGRRVEKIQAPGITNRNKAWQLGMRQRRATKYRRYVYSFQTELDALNSRYLSYTALGDDVPGYNQSAILEAYAPIGGGHVMVSSEPLNWSAGGVHMAGIRRKDGTLSGPYVATRVDDYRFTITGLDFTPDVSWQVEPPHILFGPVARWSYPALITDISPRGSSGASVTAINYDARVYDDDNNLAPS